MHMRELKMLDRGPNKNYRKGSVVTVDDLRAQLLVEGGHAADPETEPAEPKVTKKIQKKGVTNE